MNRRLPRINDFNQLQVFIPKNLITMILLLSEYFLPLVNRIPARLYQTHRSRIEPVLCSNMSPPGSTENIGYTIFLFIIAEKITVQEEP